MSGWDFAPDPSAPHTSQLLISCKGDFAIIELSQNSQPREITLKIRASSSVFQNDFRIERELNFTDVHLHVPTTFWRLCPGSPQNGEEGKNGRGGRYRRDDPRARKAIGARGYKQM